jgi:hypothetical protein
VSYLGLDVLPVRSNLRDAVAESFGRRGVLVESAVGAREFDDHAGIALPVRSFTWTCIDRTACVELRTFLDARKGRLVPFWAPTCCRDLQLMADAAPGTTIIVRRAGYSDYLFGLGPARQYLAIVPAGGAPLLRKVVNAVPASSTTETLTIDNTTGMTLTVGTTAISFLVLCRLAADFTDIEWSSPSRCEARLSFVELPREVPA